SPRAARLRHQAAELHDEPRDSRRVRHRTRSPRRKAEGLATDFCAFLWLSLVMNFEESVGYLLSLGHEMLAIKLGLRNTELLLSALDNPERAFPSVQIAGTNGKGSTAVMLDSICRAAGIKTGL